MQRAYLFGGGLTAKALSVDQFFQYLKDADSGVPRPSSLYASVAWVYRCVQLRSQAISSIPYVITRNGVEVEWIMPLERLLWYVESALLCYGAAYLLKRRNRVTIRDLQWLNPSTVRVLGDEERGLTGFQQTSAGGKVKFRPEDVVYFRYWNPSDDIGPGIAPMRAAMEAAGLVASANTWAAKFFEHGAIPAVILTTEQNVPEPELERVRTMWERMAGGVKRAWRTIVLRGGMKPTVIGTPVRDLAMPELTTSVRQQIAIAFGVPESMVGDPASNYATARTNRLSFWQDTIIPEARQIEMTLNEQLFDELGLAFAFRYGMIEAIQQDEAEKAKAVVALVDANIMTLEEARVQMGLQEQPRPSVEQKRVAAERMRALRQWRDKARKRGKVCDFESPLILPGLAQGIKGMMEHHGVSAAFMFLKTVPEGMDAAGQRLSEKIAEQLDDYLFAAATAVTTGEEFDYGAMESGLQGVIQVELSRVAAEQALREAAAAGLDVDVAAVNIAALSWAREYSYDLVKGLTETTRGLIGEVISRFIETPGMTVGEVQELLRPAFGDIRARLIATTEITRAYSQGSLIYQRLLRGYGIVMVRVWRTSKDERVCPICGPLDGQTEDEWGEQFPDGPPAHPGCRCWVNLQMR